MSTSHVTVKLNRSLVEDARQEAAALSRSVSAQLEHWMRLGRAVEAHDVLSHRQTRQVLDAPNPWAMLEDARNAEETNTAFEAMIEFFRNPPPDVVAAYQEIGSRPGAVGDDENGVLVRMGEDGKRRPI